jgi:hypothetical protein
VACLDYRQDCLTGVITEFQVEYLPTGHAFASTDPPVAMADSGDTAFARVWVTLVGIEEEPARPAFAGPAATVVRGALLWGADGSRQNGERLELLDASGRIVLTRPLDHLTAGLLSLDVSHLPAGVYFVRQKGLGEQGYRGSSAKVVLQR